MAAVGKVKVNDTDWQKATDLFLTLLPGAVQAAGVECAHEVKQEAGDLLKDFAHAPGTYSAAPPGGPPGEITGELAASFVITETNDGAMVGPTTDYAREQELGGGMHGHPTMRWRNVGGRWTRHLVILPPRPYLKPATDRVVDSGMATIIYVDHLERVIAVVAP